MKKQQKVLQENQHQTAQSADIDHLRNSVHRSKENNLRKLKKDYVSSSETKPSTRAKLSGIMKTSYLNSVNKEQEEIDVSAFTQEEVRQEEPMKQEVQPYKGKDQTNEELKQFKELLDSKEKQKNLTNESISYNQSIYERSKARLEQRAQKLRSMQEEKKQKEEAELLSCTFKPNLRLTQSNNKSQIKGKDEFIQSQQEWLEKQKEKKKKIQESENEKLNKVCTHKPILSPESRRIVQEKRKDNLSPEMRLYEYHYTSQERIQKKREEQVYSFKPELSPRSRQMNDKPSLKTRSNLLAELHKHESQLYK